MQDINQQLYENKSTPEGFIPVYGVVITVPTGIYGGGDKEFTCDKTFDEVKEILLKGGSLIGIDNNGNRINFNRIAVTKNNIKAELEYYSDSSFNKIDLNWTKNIDNELKNISTYKFISNNNIIQSYDIGNITTLLTNSGSKEEVLAAINSIFTNFAGFATAIGKPNSVFHNGKCGTFNVRYTDNIIIIQWSNANAIHHVALSEDGSYVYNIIQIVDQTLYRLSALTVEPIVNPKIWIGTAVQYAAIAQKDNNTTYIVKSNT